MAQPSNTFIHFGCWNNGICSSAGKNGVSAVIQTLQRELKNTSPLFISVAGDNYYPEKIESATNQNKQKIIHPDKLKSGFDCLKTLQVPIKMLLGNHDLETNMNNIENNDKGIFIQNGHKKTPEPQKSCKILNSEIAAISAVEKKGLIEIKRDFLSEPPVIKNTLILMIDTSMYDTQDTNMYFECYKQLDDSIDSIDSLRTSQKKRVVYAISRHPEAKNIVLIGHHPITGYKLKEEKKEDSKKKDESLKKKDKPKKKSGVYLIDPFPEFVKLWKEIIQKSPDKNLYYLCADLHLYQPGTVTIDNKTIEQYIVGTGGSKLDPDPFKNAVTLPTDIAEIKYTMNEEQKQASQNSNGFLTVQVSDDKITFEFIDIATQLSSLLPKKSKSVITPNVNKHIVRSYSERLKDMREKSNRHLLQSSSLDNIYKRNSRRPNSSRGGKHTRKYKRRSLRKPK
jgi:hypothetical protein